MVAGQGSKQGLFAKIESEEDAVKIVHAGSLVFFAVGAFLLVLSYWYGRELLIDGAGYIVLGFFLRQFKSRVIAILLALLVVVAALFALGVVSGRGVYSGINVIVAVIAVWATFKLRGKFAKAPEAT